MEFKFNVDASVATKLEAGVDTGIHKVKIEKGLVSKTKNGNNILDVFLETENGQKFAVYGICIDEKWTSGADNMDFPVWNELAILAGMKTGEMVDTHIEMTKKGEKVNAERKEFTELRGKSLTVAVYWEFDFDSGKERKRRKLSRVFNKDGFSISEIQAKNSTPKAIIKLEDRLGDYYTKAHRESSKQTNTEAPATDSGSNHSSETEAEDLI